MKLSPAVSDYSRLTKRRTASLASLLGGPVQPRKLRAGRKPRTLMTSGLTAADRAEMEATERELDSAGVDRRRPRTLEQCPPATEPCPFASCRYNLLVEVIASPAGVPHVKVNFPGRDVDQLDETCALRVARRQQARREALTDEAVGALLNITGERARQTLHRALRKLRHLPIYAELAAQVEDAR